MNGTVVVVDHADSFAFILGEQFARTGAHVVTVRSDVALTEFAPWLAEQDPDLVVLSPGPGRPEDTGVTLPWLATDPGAPILGVCLGFQAMAHADGGRVGHAPSPVHGRAARIAARPPADTVENPPAGNLLARAFMAEIGDSTPVARYHSLAVLDPGESHVALAHTEEEAPVLMAMAHRTRPRLGFQFHPESILTPDGGRMVASVLNAALAHRRTQS